MISVNNIEHYPSNTLEVYHCEFLLSHELLRDVTQSMLAIISLTITFKIFKCNIWLLGQAHTCNDGSGNP
jgi:hypothetical protein